VGKAALEDLGRYVAHEDEGYLRGDLALNGRGALLDLGAEANGDVLDLLRYFLTSFLFFSLFSFFLFFFPLFFFPLFFFPLFFFSLFSFFLLYSMTLFLFHFFFSSPMFSFTFPVPSFFSCASLSHSLFFSLPCSLRLSPPFLYLFFHLFCLFSNPFAFSSLPSLSFDLFPLTLTPPLHLHLFFFLSLFLKVYGDAGMKRSAPLDETVEATPPSAHVHGHARKAFELQALASTSFIHPIVVLFSFFFF